MRQRVVQAPLDLARLRTHSPELTAIGLAATVARPYELAAYLVPHKGQAATGLAEIVVAREGAKADAAALQQVAHNFGFLIHRMAPRGLALAETRSMQFGQLG